MQVVEAVRRFGETPLKHRKGKYLLDCLLKHEDLLQQMKFVASRGSLPNTMLLAQAGAEGPSFELEIGAVEREHVSLINGRLVKQTRRNRALWLHDPVRALEVLQQFTGALHVQFVFAGEPPAWYEQIVAATPLTSHIQPDFANVVRAQMEMAMEAIVLKHEIDEALEAGDREQFRLKARKYRTIVDACLWQL